MATIDRPIFKEIAKIQRGIGLPPSTDKLDYGKCRAYTKDSKQCQRVFGKKRDALVANLLSEFQHVTEYSEIDNFYDKIARFIDLTHCHSHSDRGLEAFSKWKTERIAAASSSSSTLATNPILSSDSLDTSSENSSVASPTPSSPVSGSLGCNPSASDLCVEETMRHLVLNTNIQKATTQRSNADFDQARAIRDEVKKLGNVELPDEDAQQDPLEIYKTIKNPPHPSRMSNGIIYMYKHTSISGIFKIGYTTRSTQRRQRQPGNCYGVDTEIIYETEKPFVGAYQAERIIHAVLGHKRIQIYNCSICGSGHQEWFLTSREEALEIVKCAESWLQMPAYTMHQRKFKLRPRAEVIYGSMFSFSLAALNQHIDNNDAPDDTSDVFSVNQLAAAIREINIPTSTSSVTGNGLFRGQAGKSSTTALPIRPNEQISPIRRAANALEMMKPDEIEELTRVRRLRSIHLDGDEEDIEDEESQELGSDEEDSEAEEPQELYIDEDYNQVGGVRARAHRQPNDATPLTDIDIVRLLEHIRKRGAREFRVIFPSQDL